MIVAKKKYLYKDEENSGNITEVSIWIMYVFIIFVSNRFRYQYPAMAREAYGRVVTKAPPNVVRTPDYDEVHIYTQLVIPTYEIPTVWHRPLPL